MAKPTVKTLEAAIKSAKDAGLAANEMADATAALSILRALTGTDMVALRKAARDAEAAGFKGKELEAARAKVAEDDRQKAQEKEFDALFRSAGGVSVSGLRSIGVMLRWDNTTGQGRRDLGLHTTPSGSKDCDAQRNVDKPVENIVWPNNANAGRYKVGVMNHSCDKPGSLAKFEVFIRTDGGCPSACSKLIKVINWHPQPRENLDVAEFTYEPGKPVVWNFVR